jgi:hypothetical protein
MSKTDSPENALLVRPFGCPTCDQKEKQVADAAPLYGHNWYTDAEGKSVAVPMGFKGPLPSGFKLIPGQVPRLGTPIYKPPT